MDDMADRYKKIIINETESVVEPPFIDEYEQLSALVFKSPYHGKEETADNLQTAEFISKKLKVKVFLLPTLNPQNPTEAVLRSKYSVRGTFPNKNPDFLIAGKLFDGKNMLNITVKEKDRIKKAIEDRIATAKMQADNIILKVPSKVERATIHRTLVNYIRRTSKERIIYIIWKNKLLIYRNKKKR
jgi:hypothetical protein